MSFYLSLFLFILSLIIGLAFMIGGKGMSRDKFMLLASMHGILFFAFIASLILRENNSFGINNYFFTAFICSGIMLSGLSWRCPAPIAMRIYFSLFTITLPMFLISPSMLLNFLLTMNYSSTNGPSFHLYQRYFIEEQGMQAGHSVVPHYKVILKRGIFHQTIQRDIEFGNKLDSIKVLTIDPGMTIDIRGYTSTRTYVSSKVDSMDVTIQLFDNKPGSVQYQL